LANDPHLSPTLPSYWYLAHVRTPDWAVAGASFVGAPAFPAGHNGWIAWGLTAGCVDNTDLFVEEIGPDGQSVRQGGDFIPCEVVQEEIRVKGGAPVEEKVLITPRGPIVSPALEGDFRAMSMRATWMAVRPLRGLLHIHRARSGEEFRTCFEQWPALSLNMVFAEATGTIGWQLIGEAPQRREGWGTIPLPGWDTKVGWEKEPLPFAQMPHLINPDTGFVVTANAQPRPTGEGPFLGVDWIDGYRHARIAELLDARRDWDVPSVQVLQVDQLTILWREVREAVLAVPAQVKLVRQGLALLKAWDGKVSADSPAAAVFELLFAEMLRRVVSAKAPHAIEWALGKSSTPLIARSMLSLRLGGYMSRLIRQQPDGWFDDGWPHELADALAKVVQTLRDRHGEQVEKWAWGRVRPLTVQHAVGGRPPLDRVFNLGPFPWGGDATTVGQAAVHLANPTSNSFFVASLRVVIDVGNWDASRYILLGGQSGNPLSPHYADQLPLWRKGEGIPIAWSLDSVDQAALKTLRLIPR
jgi:penicillin amidase